MIEKHARHLAVAGIVLATGLVILMAALMPEVGPGGVMWGPGMMWGYDGAGIAPIDGGWRLGTGMVLGRLAMLLSTAALIVGLLSLSGIVRIGGTSRTSQVDDAALDVLRRRFAAGEITEQEYEERRRVLAH